MFIVFNKNKITTYLISLGTVLVLFSMPFMINNSYKTIETMSHVEKNLPIYCTEIEDKEVALTINCAWNADDIDSILETLDKYKIHITFFMVGTWVDKYEDKVKKIYEAGHEIANHSDTHPHVNNLSYDKNVDEIKNLSDKIEKITGKKTNLYRCPYGEYNDTVIKAAKSQNHIVVQWNIDTLDYKESTKEEMIKRINAKLKPGSIILMHNGTKNTSDSLDEIIYNIKEKEYNIVTVSKLIYKDNYYIDANGIQRFNKAE